MPFSFFHLPLEVRDRIYSNLRTVGTFSVECSEDDDDETIKATINVKPSTSHLSVSKRFKNEYIATVFSGATLAFGLTSSIHPPKTPVLPILVCDNVKTCKIDLLIPYEAHKVQKEAQLNAICDPDMFLDLPFEEGERIRLSSTSLLRVIARRHYANPENHRLDRPRSLCLYRLRRRKFIRFHQSFEHLRIR